MMESWVPIQFDQIKPGDTVEREHLRDGVQEIRRFTVEARSRTRSTLGMDTSNLTPVGAVSRRVWNVVGAKWRKLENPVDGSTHV